MNSGTGSEIGECKAILWERHALMWRWELNSPARVAEPWDSTKKCSEKMEGELNLKCLFFNYKCSSSKQLFWTAAHQLHGVTEVFRQEIDKRDFFLGWEKPLHNGCVPLLPGCLKAGGHVVLGQDTTWGQRGLGAGSTLGGLSTKTLASHWARREVWVGWKPSLKSLVCVTHTSITSQSPGRVVLKGIQQSNTKARQIQSIVMPWTLWETEFNLPERPSAPGRNEKMYFKAQQ